MSRENVEIVKRAQPTGIDMVSLFRGSNAPDPAATGIDVTVFDSDFEVEFVSATAGSLRPRSRGPQGLAEAWRDWLEPWETYYVEVEEFIDAGDEVVVFARIRGQTARDGVRVEHSPAAIWSIRDGNVAKIQFYLDRDEALESAGLQGIARRVHPS
jgi:ketosteroid isomerase-like protein